VEKPEDCIVRMSKMDLLSQPAAQKAQWIPTFTYDITEMDEEAVDELVAATGARMENRSASGSSGADAKVPAALYSEGDASFLRLRDRPVIIANVAAAGCAFQRPDMRLVNWNLEPPSQ
jgi:hypothetical protein